GGVAIELFEVADRSAPPASHRLRRVARAEPGAHELEARAARGGEYVVRIQPAPGHEGLYRIAIRGAAPAKGSGAALVLPSPDGTCRRSAAATARRATAAAGSTTAWTSSPRAARPSSPRRTAWCATSAFPRRAAR